LLPRPSSTAVSGGVFRLDASTTLSAPPPLYRVAGWLRATLGPPTGCFLPDVPAGSGDGDVSLSLDDSLGAEGYRLEVTHSRVRVVGGDAAGVFYGAQTLRQLLPPAVFRAARTDDGPWEVPVGTVVDAPRFGWRGCLLDVARHFLPPADVRRFIDLLAMHKLNVLHLHLTDDQGWRLEVPAWPRLVTVGGWRRHSMVGARRHERYDDRPHGGYYGADDLREIVAYAADRHVRVVPEVDLPGHVGAALAAYPSLGAPPSPAGPGPSPEVRAAWGISPHVLAISDEALGFCRDVLDTVCDIFPDEYVCIGGDEVPTDEWADSPRALALMSEAGLSTVDELRGWFAGRLAEHLAGRGRRTLCWDEVLTAGAPPGSAIAAWRGPEATVAAARAGHDVVAMPNTSVYLDYRQSTGPDEPIPVGKLLSLAGAYALPPVPDGLSEAEAARVIGVAAAIWTEHMDSARVIDYMAFPRLCAVAEVAWSGPGHSYADFAGRLRVHEARLRAAGVEYRHNRGPHPWQTRPDAAGWVTD
jgi:hexosaminidase